MNENILRLTGSAIIIVLLIIGGIALASNSRNKRDLKNQKLQNESLMSQRNKSMQDMDSVKSDMAALKSRNEATNKKLAKEVSFVSEKEGKIAYISKENASLKKDTNELQKSKNALDKANEDLKLKNESSLSRIRTLENSAVALDADKKELINKLKNEEKYRIDNVELYASRGNKRNNITFLARKAKELNLNFETPLTRADNITYRIITPAGMVINPHEKLSAWKITDHSPQKMTASLSSGSADAENTWKIELKDNSNHKLKSGEYKIEVLSDDLDLGSYRIKLR